MNREIIYAPDENGFLKQKDPQPFNYTMEYKEKQSTDSSMTWLRMGWLSAFVPYDDLKKFDAVDIGSGNGTFVRETKKVFKRVVPFDLVGESIPEQELYDTHWDLVVLSDVLEHYHSIDDLWLIHFDYAFISFPEAPRIEELTGWRHYKPDEHIYALTLSNVVSWAKKKGCIVVGAGCPEDMIRIRANPEKVNISTLLIKSGASTFKI